MDKLIFNPKLNKKDKYIVAVSGGPDSMALLFQLVASNFNIVVAHVNYKMRVSADEDQKLVSSFCKSNSIKFYTISPKEKPHGNFQDWARRFRYNFFKDIYVKEKCDALLIAHHQDDKIETYLLKKNRPAIYSSASLLKETLVYGMKVIRPLLEYKKEQLINFCKLFDVKFNIDETNIKPTYARNIIRNDIVSKLTDKQRKNYLDLIDKEQQIIDKSNKEFEKKYQNILFGSQLNLKKLTKLESSYQIKILYRYLTSLTSINPATLSSRKLRDYLKQLSTNKPNLNIKLSHELYLTKSYETLHLTKSNLLDSFSYTLNKLTYGSFKDFTLEKMGEPTTGVKVFSTDFPLTVRSFQLSDRVSLKKGHKLVKRLFIDKKVPMYLRNKVPILINAKGEILLVSKYYVNPERKRLQSNLFVVKC